MIVQKLVSRDVINSSSISFGTSGARGLVVDFTPQVCAAFTHAFVAVLRDEFAVTQLALAIDNRPSSYAIAQACAAALQQVGIEAIYYGVIPTPALAYQAMQDNMPCIMVTGSHIPFDRNGLKFYRPDGEITKTDELAILAIEAKFHELPPLPQLIVSTRASETYCSRYRSLFTPDLLAGKRVGIYEHSSAGRDLYKPLFEQLGATVISLERSDEFVPIDTEAVSHADIEKAKQWSSLYSLDFIFSTDGDGDRPLVADEKGNWLRGDILGLLCAEALSIEALAVPVSCNTAIELSYKFTCVERTKIGSPYVIEKCSMLLDKYNSVAGFEANGGFLLGSSTEINGKPLAALPTRDALLPALMLLALAKKSSISSLVNELPKRYTDSDRIQNFPIQRSKSIIELGIKSPQLLIEKIGFNDCKVSCVDNTDGLRVTFENGNIIHLRPSGNAPELRCYAESDSAEVSKEYVSVCLKNVQSI